MSKRTATTVAKSLGITPAEFIEHAHQLGHEIKSATVALPEKLVNELSVKVAMKLAGVPVGAKIIRVPKKGKISVKKKPAKKKVVKKEPVKKKVAKKEPVKKKPVKKVAKKRTVKKKVAEEPAVAIEAPVEEVAAAPVEPPVEEEHPDKLFEELDGPGAHSLVEGERGVPERLGGVAVRHEPRRARPRAVHPPPLPLAVGAEVRRFRAC